MPEKIGSYLSQWGIRDNRGRVSEALLYYYSFAASSDSVLKTPRIPSLLLQLKHFLLLMDTLMYFISLFRLGDTLPFVQIPNCNNVFLHFNVCNISFLQLAPRAGEIKGIVCLDLFPSRQNAPVLPVRVTHVVPRNKNAALFTGLPSSHRSRKLGRPVRFSAGLHTSEFYHTSSLTHA